MAGFNENIFTLVGTTIAILGVGLYIWDTRIGNSTSQSGGKHKSQRHKKHQNKTHKRHSN